MNDIYYKIEMLDDWHAGSGLSAGVDVDLLVIKDSLNFPFIPGKTLKGLLKDGAMDLVDAGVLEREKVVEIFGEDARKNNNGDEVISKEGNVYFTNAELTLNMKQQLKEKTHLLYRKISATAIEKNGLVKEKSLRRIEMTVPIILFAKIENVSTPDQREILEKCMKMVKRLGSWRNRGYGRCEISMLKGDTQ